MGIKDIALWRQVFVMSSSFLYSMAATFAVAFPGALNPAITSPNATDIRATTAQASWLAGINGLTGSLSFFIISPALGIFGRKIVVIGISLCIFIGFIGFYFAKSIMVLFIARLIQGLAAGGLLVNVIIISEYAHPTRRGYFSTFKKLAGAFGGFLCHGLTLTCNWRQIAAVALIPSCLSIIVTLFWPESPYFLATKGRFDKCEKSFRWLRGNKLEDEKELRDLLSSQKERLEKEKLEKWNAKKILSKMMDKGFLKAFLMIVFILIIVETCGRFYFITYVIQIMTKLTGDKSIAVYCALGADVLAMIALFMSSFIITFFSRRVLLFGFGGFSVFLMFLVGILVLLEKVIMISSWAIPSILLFHYFIINISVIPVCYTLFGELLPLDFRAIGTCTVGVVMKLFYMVIMVLTPTLMENTGVGGTYSIYGCCILFCLTMLYFILPETKDKTLLDIEREIRGDKYFRSRKEETALVTEMKIIKCNSEISESEK